MKKIIYSWFGFVSVIVFTFFTCGILILFLSRTDSSFSKWIAVRHIPPLLFAEINSDYPIGLSKEDFLAEVRYLGNLKEQLDLLEEGILLKIIAAFKVHPWVEKVEGMQRENLNNLRVNLLFRKPRLIVPMLDSSDPVGSSENYRVVDENAIILPKNANRTGLPVFYKPLQQPNGNAGSPWGNEEVLVCAKVAANILDAISLPKDCLIEIKGGLIQLYSENNHFKILWGGVSLGNSSEVADFDKRRIILSEKYALWVKAGKKDEFLLDLSKVMGP